jgi:hypothetical protein
MEARADAANARRVTGLAAAVTDAHAGAPRLRTQRGESSSSLALVRPELFHEALDAAKIEDHMVRALSVEQRPGANDADARRRGTIQLTRISGRQLGDFLTSIAAHGRLEVETFSLRRSDGRRSPRPDAASSGPGHLLDVQLTLIGSP